MPLTDTWTLPDILLVPGDNLEQYFARIQSVRPLDPATEAAVGAAARAGDRGARIRLAQSGLRWAAHLARKHYARTPHPQQGDGVWSLADAVQAANLGLWIATARYDPHISRFTTYATAWIRQSLERSRGQFLYAIRLPSHAEQEWLQYRRAVDQWQKHHLTDPTPEDLKPWLPWPVSRIRFWQHWGENMAALLSLDASPTDDADALGTIIAADDDTGLLLRQMMWREMIAVLWDVLTQREQEVIRCRFGFYGAPMTLQDISCLLLISRERVRQIEAKALAKMRAYVALHPEWFADWSA